MRCFSFNKTTAQEWLRILETTPFMTAALLRTIYLCFMQVNAVDCFRGKAMDFGTSRVIDQCLLSVIQKTIHGVCYVVECRAIFKTDFQDSFGKNEQPPKRMEEDSTQQVSK